jgi:hypothetical protein
MGLMTLMSYMLGAFTSLGARNQRAAFSSAFGILVGILFVLPLVSFMLEAYHVFGTGKFAEFLVGCTNPGTYLSHVSEALSRDSMWEGWRESWDQRGRELLPTFTIYAGVYSGAVVGLAAWMIQRFDRAAGRS